MDNFPVEFKSDFKEKHITAIIDIDGTKIGLRFDTPEYTFRFIQELMELAIDVWPDHPVIQNYLGSQ